MKKILLGIMVSGLAVVLPSCGETAPHPQAAVGRAVGWGGFHPWAAPWQRREEWSRRDLSHGRQPSHRRQLGHGRRRGHRRQRNHRRRRQPAGALVRAAARQPAGRRQPVGGPVRAAAQPPAAHWQPVVSQVRAEARRGGALATGGRSGRRGRRLADAGAPRRRIDGRTRGRSAAGGNAGGGSGTGGVPSVDGGARLPWLRQGHHAT